MVKINGIDLSDAPAFKTVFKAQTKDINYSRNTPEACELCSRVRKPGEKPLQLCTGCREARFCVRDTSPPCFSVNSKVSMNHIEQRAPDSMLADT